MANPAKRLPANVPGPFFVDATCIDCDTCRQLAPGVFGEAAGASFVRTQPGDPEAEREAFRALLSCPTGSIGTTGPNRARDVLADFPLPLAEDVWYLGFNSERSFGGNAYLVRTPGGLWMVDSPRFVPHLVDRIAALGGLAGIFLTHQDDVADAHRYAARFGARRVIHRADLAAQPDAEQVLEGEDPVELGPELLAIPTPGHTRGSCVLLARGSYLFTGDHLWWDRDTGHLGASRGVCWYSWPEQTASMAKLARYRFAWVLPGHGDRVHRPEAELAADLEALVARMRARS